jgi:hypothetical protein
MKIKLTKSGISFGSLIKLISVGYFIGMGILFVFIFVPLVYSEWRETTPVFLWLMFPIMIAAQSLIFAVIVAAGVKLYGKFSKFETSSCGRLTNHSSGRLTAPADFCVTLSFNL